MVIHDLYPEKSKVMLLIHPMLASSESMKKYLVENILKVADEYRFIITFDEKNVKILLILIMFMIK